MMNEHVPQCNSVAQWRVFSFIMQVLIFQWDLSRINKKYAISPDFCCKYGMTVIYQHLSSHPSSSPSLHHSCSVPQLLNRCHDSESGLRLGHAHTPVVAFSLTHTQTHTLCTVGCDPCASLGAWMASSVWQMLWSAHRATWRREAEMFALAFEWEVLCLCLFSFCFSFSTLWGVGGKSCCIISQGSLWKQWMKVTHQEKQYEFHNQVTYM